MKYIVYDLYIIIHYYINSLYIIMICYFIFLKKIINNLCIMFLKYIININWIDKYTIKVYINFVSLVIDTIICTLSLKI